MGQDTLFEGRPLLPGEQPFTDERLEDTQHRRGLHVHGQEVPDALRTAEGWHLALEMHQRHAPGRGRRPARAVEGGPTLPRLLGAQAPELRQRQLQGGRRGRHSVSSANIRSCSRRRCARVTSASLTADSVRAISRWRRSCSASATVLGPEGRPRPEARPQDFKTWMAAGRGCSLRVIASS